MALHERTDRTGGPSTELPPVSELLHRLVADGRRFATAEIEVQRRGLAVRAARGRVGLIMVVAGLVIVHLALIAGAVELAAALATLIGPLAAGLVVLLLGVAAGGLLVKAGVSRMIPAFKPIDPPAEYKGTQP